MYNILVVLDPHQHVLLVYLIRQVIEKLWQVSKSIMKNAGLTHERWGTWDVCMHYVLPQYKNS